jgi:hypothetical protein
MNIRSLLNPYELDSHYGYRSTESHHSYRSSASPTPAILPRSVARDTHTSKRTKIPKDAPIFTGAKVNGPVNFPPYEFVRDEELRKQHCKFQVHPLGDIQRNGARRIPYNSDKKDFMTKTGRDAFEGKPRSSFQPSSLKPSQCFSTSLRSQARTSPTMSTGTTKSALSASPPFSNA